MDLSTSYMGMKLKSPLVPSSSPLTHKLDNLKKMEDAGAGAVVLYSLFEEELALERFPAFLNLESGSEAFVDSLTYFPDMDEYTVGPDAYCEHIRKAKEALDIPVFGSLNGPSLQIYADYAKRLEEAGADGIELNMYAVEANPMTQGKGIESYYYDTVQEVTQLVSIPVAVKLSPYFTSMANFAAGLANAGADGLVMFNRFYQPDIFLETMEVKPNLLLSTPQDLRLPMRWIAILYDRTSADLAATSGIHRAVDVVKMLMAGANVTMLCSVLLRHGVDHIKVISKHLEHWLERKEYESVDQIRGVLSHKNCAHPEAFERAQYIKTLSNYAKDKR